MMANHEKVVGGAGHWIIKSGKFYDPERKCYIFKCRNCHLPFYAARLDAKTCSDVCRQQLSRAEKEQML